MADRREAIEAALAGLTTDLGFARFVRPGAALLVWDGAGERVLWRSPAAAGLALAAADASGAVNANGSVPSSARLRVLANGLAPRRGARLERIRLDANPVTGPTTCACRLVTLSTGEEVLVTSVIGTSLRSTRGVGDPHALTSSVFESAEQPTAPTAAAAVHQGRTVRFLWHADRSGRFTAVSDALVGVVGAASASIVGRRWAEIAGSLVDDPAGVVASAFQRGETFSRATVFWSVAGTDAVMPVDFSGMPVHGRERQLIGFRGFGLCRTGETFSRSGKKEQAAATEEQVGTEQSDESRLLAAVAALASQAAAPAIDEEAPEEPLPDEDRTEEPVARPEPGSRLSSAERSAFREIARALGARFEHDDAAPPEPSSPERRTTATRLRSSRSEPDKVERILDRLPIGILVHRGDEPLFASRVLLDLVGYEDVRSLAREGGVPRLFRGRSRALTGLEDAAPLALSTRRNESVPVEVRLTTVEWDSLPASVMLIRRAPDADPNQRVRALELDLRARDSQLRELSSILDTATDGVVVLDDFGRILSLNRSAEALFGYDQNEVAGEPLIVLLSPESHVAALDYLGGLRSNGMASLLNDGREVLGRVRQGGTIPLFMTVGCISEAPERKFCAVLRDITAFKKTEGELLAAKRAAEDASAQKSDFLAKVSHEVRTPLNAIIGFAEVMLEERFGPIGNERYKDYLRDIHASGGHVISLVNDLLDLAKVEAGRMELAFASVSLNELVASCVTLMQPQTLRERIVMRTSFAPKLPPVVADERSVRQIVLNIVSNAIKFTEAGGQVIVSTAITDRGEIAIRVRDTGIGMSPEEVKAALEPFRQLSTSRRGGGTGLGLPLTKALVEANRGTLHITSARNEGTLVEVLFPPTRVLAE